MGGGDLRRTVSNAIKNIMKYSLHTYCTLYVRVGHLLEIKTKKKSQLNNLSHSFLSRIDQIWSPIVFVYFTSILLWQESWGTHGVPLNF